MQNKLFVGNLSWDLKEEDLKRIFAETGEVVSVIILTDRATGRSRGFGFVEMSSPEDAQAAIKSLNGQEVGGRALNVSLARVRPEH